MQGYGDNCGSCAHYIGNLLCCGQNDPLSHMFFLNGTILTQKYTMLREIPVKPQRQTCGASISSTGFF